jgi:predicted TIM-barrel fold metal-dependent hydrolase
MLLLVACTNVTGQQETATVANEKPPIIDMHLHAFPVTFYDRKPGDINPISKQPAPMSDDEFMQAIFERMDHHNIVKAMISGPRERVAAFTAARPDQLIGSIYVEPKRPLPDLEQLRADYESGFYEAMGEVTIQYLQISPSDPEFEPYLALAEEFDIPVGIHMGFTRPGGTYMAWPGYRAADGNPLLIEEALVRHPKLRIFVMHAGWPFLDEMKAVMWAHPQLYVDISLINWMAPRAEFHHYLQALVRSGFGKRIMHGSDHAIWPDNIDIALDALETAEFLTAEQKRDILYNNAARFLRLEE